MAQQQFHPRPPDTPKLDSERVEVQIPLTQPETTKPPLLQRILPFVMILAVGGFVVLMVSTSGSFNPYMMMMPLMLLVGVLGFLGGNGASNTDLNGERRNYFLGLREQRTIVHRQGEAMFKAQEMSFPQPSRLASLVGIDEHDAPSMWTVRAANPGGFITRSGTPDEKAFRPYLAARLGRGTVDLEPQIVTKELPVAEQLEPVTLGAYRKFLRTQRFVPEFPIGYYLGRAPFHSLIGDDERTLPLVRAMIASLAFNHSPDELELALVTDDPDGHLWSAFKWLPHANDPSRMTADGAARRIYLSLSDFADDLPESVRKRPPFQGSSSAPTDGADRDYPHMVVFVDLPAAQVRLPEAFGVAGIDGITLLVIRAGVNELPAADDAALIIDQDGKISTAVEPALITADAMSVAEFDTFARTMSGYTTGTEIALPGLIDHTPKPQRRTAYLSALGLDDLESFDAYEFWRRRENDRERRIPLGDLIDETTLRPTGELAELSFSEGSIGGSGPHGAGQGKTGTGKSFLLQPMVLSLATLYSPAQVAFILMDFKGGATFMGYEQLPHVLANITNLAKDRDLLVRAEMVIRGEMTKRFEIFDKAKVGEILDYNKLREKDPDKYPALPELFIIVDEFGEFISENRDFLKLFSSITKVGRSLGIHLLLFSQYINSQVIGDIGNNLSFGISLAAANSSDSRFVVGTDAATHLKSGAGHAYLRREGRDDGLVMMQGFDVGAPYVPIIAPVADVAVSGDSLDDAVTDSTLLMPFTSISSAPLGDDDEAPIVIEESVLVNPDEHVEVRQALFDRLARFQDIQPRQLWQPTLAAPISFHGAQQPVLDGRGLQIRIGDIDDPANHRRIPYTIRPEGANAHIRVVGARSSGKSTTLQTIIASAAFTYDPRQVQFYLIDFGSKLREVEHYPNVGARASGADNELIDRILAEFKRVVSVRVDEFEARRVASYAAYAESKATSQVDADPYGEMFLVIDGINEFLPATPDAANAALVEKRTNTLIEIAKAGGSRGIHLVIAGEMETGKTRFYNEFGLFILHATSDPAQFTTLLTQEIRNVYKSMPTDQPGRAVEPKSGLHARVFVPQLEEITPIPGTTPPMYDLAADYSSGIRALGDMLAAKYTAPGWNGEPQSIRAFQIDTVAAQLPWDSVWPVYQSTRQHPTAPRSLPLGAAVDDLSLVMLPVDDPRSVPYLLVVGDAQSGRTNTVRSLLRSIMEQYKPHEAQVYLFDPAFTMMTERKILEHLGLLASYENQPQRIAQQAQNIEAIIRSRQPDETVTAEQIASGTWYSGPKIFVIIDPVTALVGGSFEATPTDALVDAIDLQRNLGMSMGLHVIATETTNQFMSRRASAKFFKTLAGANADILLLSGTSQEPVAGSYNSPGGRIMFVRRRPGLGQLYSPSTGKHPVVQTLLHPPFDTSL